MSTAALTSKGQITIPIEIREDLGLKAGDRVITGQLQKLKPGAPVEPEEAPAVAPSK